MTGALDLLAGDDFHRRDGFLVQALDVRARDFHALQLLRLSRRGGLGLGQNGRTTDGHQGGQGELGVFEHDFSS